MTERVVEIPWVLDHARPPILDVGCVGSVYLGSLAQPVDGIDLAPLRSPQPLRNFYQADIRTFESPSSYATVLATSTIEHIGLGYAGLPSDDEEGDRHALEACVRLSNHQVLVTIPYGRPRVENWFRQYDWEGLHKLFVGYVPEVWLWVFNERGYWEPTQPDAHLPDYDFDRVCARGVALIRLEVFGEANSVGSSGAAPDRDRSMGSHPPFDNWSHHWLLRGDRPT